VVSSAQDDSILPPDGFGCDDLGDGTCAHPVAVADDLDGFDVTLVVLDDEGYVTASLAVPFEGALLGFMVVVAGIRRRQMLVYNCYLFISSSEVLVVLLRLFILIC